MIRSEAFDRFAENWDNAVRAGLTAAAYAYVRPVKMRLMQGYTTGNFSHGGAGVAGTVTVGEVDVGAGRASVAVGTNVDYAAFWEFGHFNLYTRRYERVEVWRETFEASTGEMTDAFGRGFVRTIEGERSMPSVNFEFNDGGGYAGPNPAPGFGGYQRGTGVKRGGTAGGAP